MAGFAAEGSVYATGFEPGDSTPPAAPTFHAPTVLKVDGWLFKDEGEIEAVTALGKRLADLGTLDGWQCDSLNLDPRVLIRFCRARKLNLDQAEAMFREAKAWRDAHRPDRVRDEFVLPAVIDGYCTGGVVGRDKEGSPVFYDRIGLIDPAGLLARCTFTELEKYQMQQEEYMTQFLKEATADDKKGRVHIQVTVVNDLTGLSRAHMNRQGFEALKRVLWITDHVYCERLKKFMIINAPWIFGMIWAIVKYFVDPVTRDKIEIYNGPETERLLSLIDAEVMPTHCGGSHPDGECAKPAGPIRMGGPIPDKVPVSAGKQAELAAV